MKILILTDDFPPHSFGGAGIVAFVTARELLRRGHEVSVVTTTQNKNREGVTVYDGITVRTLYTHYHERWRAYASIYNPQVVTQFNHIISEVRPDIVHAHNVHQYLSYHCLKISKRFGAKVFLTAHDVMLFEYGKIIYTASVCVNKRLNKYSVWRQIKEYKFRYNPIRNVAIAYYLRYVVRIFAVSEVQKKLLEQNGIYNVAVIHNGIAVEDWSVAEKDVESFRSKYMLHGKKVLLFGGRLGEAKGGHKAIAAFEEVLRRIPQAVLLVMGEKNAYAKKIFESAKTARIENKVIFTGWITGNDLKAAYSACDVVLFPSICFETFGLGCIEAMACRKPVVATCFGGPGEIVKDGYTGYVINPFNTAVLAERIIDLLEDSQKATMFGDRGFEEVQKNFSLEQNMNKTLSNFNMKWTRPHLSLRLLLGFYDLLRTLKLDRLPKIKGLFYVLYSSAKNKEGIYVTVTNKKIRLAIDLADTIISSRLLQYGYWEKGLTSFMQSTIKPGMTVIDIGAHVGYYTTLLSKLVGKEGRVFSFEPEPHNFLLLQKNIDLNHITNCTIENKAVYKDTGSITLNLDPSNLGAHSVHTKLASNASVTVEAVCLDEYLKDMHSKIDFIKMDIEGAEEFAIMGAKRVLEDNPDIRIVMEFMLDVVNVLKMMRSHGFRTYVIEHETGYLWPFEEDNEILEYMRAGGYGLVNILYTKIT